MSVRLALALVFTASVACTVPGEKAENTPAPKPDPTAPARPRGLAVNVTRLYNDTCAKCHGENAEGGGGGTKSLLSLDKYDQKWDKPFFDAIKNGVPQMGMEAYGQTMSDEECWALVVHIRELQTKGLASQLAAPKPDANGVVTTKLAKFKIEDVVTSGVRTPWAIDWLPDGRMLVTSRPGPVYVYSKSGQLLGSVEGLPKSVELGQGGMMDVAVHPSYAKNGWIYLSFADPGEGGTAMTKVVRGKLTGSAGSFRWSDQQTIWQAPKDAYNGAGIHFGGKIVFDGKGHVFFSVGERGGNMAAQNPDNSIGKVMRLNEDGSMPSDNPRPGNPMWTYGHRNPQGLAFDAEGNLWDTEHAPRGGDELNLLERGSNYGWPAVCFGINYNDSPFVTPWPKPEQNIKMPQLRWITSIAASGLDTVHGSAFAPWKGDLLAGGLASTVVLRLHVKSGKFLETERIFDGHGRVREVAVGPDGLVYIALNEPDKIVRLVPTK